MYLMFMHKKVYIKQDMFYMNAIQRLLQKEIELL